MAVSASLGSGLERFVEDKLDQGMYSSKSEIIREALRRMYEEDAKLSEETVAAIDRARGQDGRPLEEVRERW